MCINAVSAYSVLLIMSVFNCELVPVELERGHVSDVLMLVVTKAECIDLLVRDRQCGGSIHV